MRSLTDRMPDRMSILAVFAVLVGLIYSWTLFASFQSLPSWIYFLDIGQILSIYAYAFTFDLVECMFAIMAILVLEFVVVNFLWARRDDFRVRAVSLVLTVTLSAGLRLYAFGGYEDIPEFLASEFAWWAITFFLVLLFWVLLPRLAWARKFIEKFADRVTVFLYLYIPLSLLSVIVVIIRNI